MVSACMSQHSIGALDALTQTPYQGTPGACPEATPAQSSGHYQTSQPGTAAEQLLRQLCGALPEMLL